MKHQGIKKLKPSQMIPWRNREAKFVCDTCGYRTKGKASLDRHIKGKHNKEKTFLCKDCGKDLKSKEYLDAHRLDHKQCISTKSSNSKTDYKTVECAKIPEKLDQIESPVSNNQPLHLADTSRATTAYFWMPQSHFNQYNLIFCLRNLRGGGA